MSIRMIVAALALAVAAIAPAAAQERVEQRGRVAHEAAGTSFPEQVGGFRRTNVVRYDPSGRDMSASYSLEADSGTMLITVYVFPPLVPASGGGREQACRTEFNGSVQAIRAGQRNMRPVGRTTLPVLSDHPADLGGAATFAFSANFSGAVQDVHSGLYLYCFVGADAWNVKYRVTYSAGFREPAALIDGFVRTGPWPGREPADTIADGSGAGPGGRRAH